MGKTMGRPKKRFRVYIAGGMHDRMAGIVRAERLLAMTLIKAAGLDYYDPAGSEGLEDRPLTWLIDSNMDRPLMTKYVAKDDRNLDKCDGLLIITGDKVSDGTWDEKAQCQYLKPRPIAMVAPRRHTGDLMTFSTVKLRKGIRGNIHDAVQYLREEAIRLGYDVGEQSSAVH